MSNPVKKIFSWLYPVQLEKTRGELGHELEVNVYNGKIMLDSANVNYSYGTLQETFDHAFTKTDLYDVPIKSALILGFGSGSVAELLLEKCNPDIKITGVEADAEVIRLAKKYFPVANHSNVTIVHGDVMEFVATLTTDFDLIVVDVFIEDIVPAACQSTTFLREIKSHLTKNGKLYFNKMKVEDDEVSMEELEKNLRAVFSKVKTVRLNMGGGTNCVYVAQLG